MKDARGHGSDSRGAAHQEGVNSAVPLILSRFSGFPNGGFHAIHPETGEILRPANAKYGDMPPRFSTEEKAEAFARKRLGI